MLAHEDRDVMVWLGVSFLVIALALSGCASVSGRAEIHEPEPGEISAIQFSVFRLMNDSAFEGLDVTRNQDDGFSLNLTGYKSESERIAEAVTKGITEGMKP